MIRFCAAHPTAANLLMLILLAMGALTVSRLQRETFPDYTPREIEVSVVYPGATAEDVEEAICVRIEEALDGVSDPEELRSEARDGVGLVVVEMREGGDFQAFSDEIRTEVDAIDDLPAAAEEAVVRELHRTDPVISIAVTGEAGLPDLKAYCEDLKRRLRRDAGISLVEVEGFSDHQIRVELSQHTLQKHGLSVGEVARMIGAQSVDLPSGTIETSERDVILRFTDERRTPLELASLVVLTGDRGAELRLGDLATIIDRFELDEDKILFNGERAGLLKISKMKSEDSLEVNEQVRAFLEEERQRMPVGVRLLLTEDLTSIVRDRLEMLVVNGLQGLALVFVTMWLFFSLRFSFWVAMGLPVTFLGALFFLPLLGQSINMMSMVALLLAIGLLMDDAIVIAENIATHLRRGKSALEAAIAGTAEVKWGVFSSFLTTVAVFGPLSFLGGDIGKVLRPVPIVLMVVLAVSLVEAFLILPHHLAHSLSRRGAERPGRFRIWFDGAIDWVREAVLGAAVDRVLRWRYLTLGVVLGAFFLTIGLVAGGRAKFQAFPDIDGDVIVARVLMPQGTPLRTAEAVGERLTQGLARIDRELAPRQPGGERLIRSVSVQFGRNVDAHESGPHVLTVSADLLGAERRDAPIGELLARWREETGLIPDVLNIRYAEPAFGPAGWPIFIRLQGADLAQLKLASLDVQSWLQAFPGVLDLPDDLRPGKPEVRLRLAAGAAALGFDARTVSDQLRAAFHGQTASEIQVAVEDYEIDVRLAEADRDGFADLDFFHVTTAQGHHVPLGAVAEMEHSRGWARIARVDGERTVSIQADVDTSTSNTAEILGELKRDFLPGFEGRFPSVRLELEGEIAESATTRSSMLKGMMIGLLGIFVLLSFQFRSYVEPLIVMVTIPFVLIGVVWGHLLMGLNLSMPSLLGLVSLAGIVVNDSILLVVFVKTRRQDGLTMSEAAGQASRDRFRAVLLTSLTTITGLIPLLLEKSLQAQILIPLATSIVFGLLASTVLILLVIPALYGILDDLGLTRRATAADGAQTS